MSIPYPPSYALFGERPENTLSAICHVERISSRAALHNGNVEAHRHPHLHQLTYWISGDGHYALEDRSYHVSPGLLCWVPAGKFHGFSVVSGSDAVVISLAREHFDEPFSSFDRGHGEQVMLNPCVIPPGSDFVGDLDALFAMAERNYGASSWACQDSIRAIASLIFIFVGQYLSERNRLETGLMLKAPLFRKLQTHVDKRFQDHPSVMDLSVHIGTTPYLLNKACRSATGLNVSNFVRLRILREVERLLLFTDFDLAQIAEQTGYTDPSHFTRAFKAFHGKTPSAWRAETINTRLRA